MTQQQLWTARKLFVRRMAIQPAVDSASDYQAKDASSMNLRSTQGLRKERRYLWSNGNLNNFCLMPIAR